MSININFPFAMPVVFFSVVLFQHRKHRYPCFYTYFHLPCLNYIFTFIHLFLKLCSSANLFRGKRVWKRIFFLWGRWCVRFCFIIRSVWSCITSDFPSYLQSFSVVFLIRVRWQKGSIEFFFYLNMEYNMRNFLCTQLAHEHKTHGWKYKQCTLVSAVQYE